ncbi:hypothetical protein X777_02398 [Ooceraea biroi]|uniref:Uncharacterized protein n=1 Tax=Ooceraea biroi TaxID=2015173 RepID=A0A026WMY3_OOCBI|nr:hypothetical protein X777_02398 [Ooceraea biroi]
MRMREKVVAKPLRQRSVSFDSTYSNDSSDARRSKHERWSIHYESERPSTTPGDDKFCNSRSRKRLS